MRLNQEKNKFVDQIQNLERTIYGMNIGGGPYKINMKKEQNSNSLISKINDPIIIPEHPHPLVSCFTPERSEKMSYWICDNCGLKYEYTVPSFYCTSCDYDICQKCIFQHPLYKINCYNYGQNEKFQIKIDKNNKNYRINIHEHIMALIKFDHADSGNGAFSGEKYCICGEVIPDTFYFCSLCNFYVSPKCFDSLNIDWGHVNPNFNGGNQNEEYLSPKQMEFKDNYLEG